MLIKELARSILRLSSRSCASPGSIPLGSIGWIYLAGLGASPGSIELDWVRFDWIYLAGLGASPGSIRLDLSSRSWR